MRKSSVFLMVLLLGWTVFCVLSVGYPVWTRLETAVRIERGRELVGKLGLTDLCLFTEASYTRHLTQADPQTAFQNHPMSPDLFPAGSMVRPPVEIWLRR